MYIRFLHINKVWLFLFVLVSGTVLGQDLHYSQFYNSPMNVNPALTGAFNGDHRFTVSHRDQWRFVPVPWTTFSGAYDRNFMPGNETTKTFYGLGANVNYDRQGDSRLSLLNLTINGAMHRSLNANNIISLGAGVGFATRGFDTGSLRWDKQWNGDVFDTNLPSQEAFQNTERIFFVETSLGLAYLYQKSDRTNLQLGVGANHIIEPKTSFTSLGDIKLPRRFSLTGTGNFRLAEKLDLQLHVLHQIQDKYNETVFGGLGKLYLNQNPGRELQMHLGLGYRTSGSFIPTLAFQVNNIYAGFNLDIDRTGFNKALNTSRGAYEIHLRYIIKNVKPFRFKNCPIL